MVYRTDKENGTIYEENRAPFPDILLTLGCTTVFRDPLRVEYWYQMVNGLERMSGEFVRRFVKRILDEVLATDVQVICGQDSPLQPGVQSAITPPLDDYIDKDSLFDGILETLKTQSFNKHLKGEVTCVQEGTDVESDEAFALYFTVDGTAMQEDPFMEFPPAVDEVKYRLHVKTNRDFSAFVIAISGQNFQLYEIQHIMLTENPLQVDAFRVRPTGCFAGELHAKVVEHCLNTAIARVKEWA
eukprot:UN3851